jgi:hypothetical protein
VKLLARLEANVFPWLGNRPIRGIKPPELLSVLRRVESRGVLETAHRLMNYCGNIYRYAVATGRAERDISSDLRGVLPPSTPQHHASVTDPEGVAALLRAIDGYRGSNVTRYALQLAPLVFVRPGELRKAEWNEVDFEAGEWRIPAERMKMKTKHIVPLSCQAVASSPGVLKKWSVASSPVAGLPAMSAVARARRPPSPAFLDPPGYARHLPERTLLYQLVEQHYPAFRELRAAAAAAA